MVLLTTATAIKWEDEKELFPHGGPSGFAGPETDRSLGEPSTAEPTDAEEVPFHRPALLSQVLGLLGMRPDGLYVDGTVGDGGHALSLLRASAPQGSVLGIDLDPRSLVRATERLAPFGHRFIPALGSYAAMADLARRAWGDSARVDGILLDLGISSRQVDGAGFGFSFQRDEPLDMRFNPDGNEVDDSNSGNRNSSYGSDYAALPTAWEIINTWPEADLARVLREYGEEPRSRGIAAALVRRRPIHTTGQLANLVAGVVSPQAKSGPKGRSAGRAGKRHSGRRTHPATRVFQALRIAVNDELAVLTAGLDAAIDLLAPGGRLAVISYHSLEDRIVKQTLARQSAQCLCPPALPICVCQHRPNLSLVNRRAIRPEAEEVADNPRSRSARLRVAQRRYDE